MKALVLSGGGAKGAYQVGALKYLLSEKKIQYDIICGVSVGAINASFLAMFPKGQEAESWKQLNELWSGISTKTIYKNWFPLSYIEALWKPSVYDSSPLADMIKNHLDGNRIKTSGKLLRMGATGLDTGKYHIFDENYPNLPGAVLASSAFPVMFLPIELEGQLWSDGGLKNITPLKAAIEAGATDIDVINCSAVNDPSSSFKSDNNAINIALRGLSLMCDQITASDMKICDLVNQLVKAGVAPDKKLINMRVISPITNLPQSSLNFDQPNVQAMITAGYADAQKIG
jgi:NTE family protein